MMQNCVRLFLNLLTLHCYNMTWFGIFRIISISVQPTANAEAGLPSVTYYTANPEAGLRSATSYLILLMPKREFTCMQYNLLLMPKRAFPVHAYIL